MDMDRFWSYSANMLRRKRVGTDDRELAMLVCVSMTQAERLTTAGGAAAALLVLGLALSPLILVFAPVLPLAVLIFITVRRDKLGTGWLVLYAVAWIVFVASFWPVLGLAI